MIGRLPAAMGCLSFLLLTAAPIHALAQDERPVPPLPIGAEQATTRDRALPQDERPVPPLPIDAKQARARDHARILSEMADAAARDSEKCQSSGAALGSQAYKKCRTLLDKMSFENDFPPDRTYARRQS
jgi:hypothetical protein